MIRSDRVHQRDRAAAGYTDVAINEQEGAPERSWLACLWRAGSLATGGLQAGDSREHGSVREGALEDTGVNSGVQRMESLELWSQGRDKLSRVPLIG